MLSPGRGGRRERGQLTHGDWPAPRWPEERTALTLYAMPVLGDAVQFIIIDQIQRYKQPPRPGPENLALVVR